jgi:hypothetical protein
MHIATHPMLPLLAIAPSVAPGLAPISRENCPMLSIAEIPLEVGLLTAIPYSFFAIAMKDLFNKRLAVVLADGPKGPRTF